MAPNYSQKIQTQKNHGKCDSYLTGLYKNMELLFQTNQFSDVTLIAEDGFKVEAHRLVLSAASTYFSSMFDGSCPEAESKEVKLKNISGHTLTLIKNFIYTGWIDLATYSVKDFLKTAHLFELTSLEEICCDFITMHIDLSNCLDITLFAEQCNNETLQKAGEAFVCHHFMEVRNKNKFFMVDHNQLSKFLSSNELYVPSEEEVFSSIMSWVEYDQPNREKFIDVLLNNVRFPFMTPDFIMNTVEPVCKSYESQKLVMKAIKWHLMPNSRLPILPEQQTQLRNCKDIMFAVSGWDKDNLKVGVYMPGGEEWIYRDWPGLPEKRTRFGYATVGGKLIVAGGELPSGDVTNRVDCLDLRTLKWTQLSPLHRARYDCKLVTLMGQVYVIGGYARGKFNISCAIYSVEKLEELERQWQDVEPMEFSGNISLAGIKLNTICVIKPINNQSSSIGIYDPSINIWSYSSTPNSFFGLGTIHDLSTDYFVTLARDSIKRYDMEPRTIPIFPSIKSAFHSCVVVGNRFIVHGKNEFQEYHPLHNEWKTMPSLENNSDDLHVFTI